MPKLSETRLTKRVVEAARPGETICDSELRGFRVVVSRSGTCRFVAAYRVRPMGGGKSKSSKMALGTFPAFTVDEAREMARGVLRKARAGIDPQEEGRAARRAEEAIPTVADLVRVYLDDYAPSQGLRSSTIRQSRQQASIVVEAMGAKKVGAVTITDIRKLHGDVRAAGIAAGNEGRYSANRLLAILSKMFSLAIERGWRTDNPCKGIRKFPEDQRWRNLSEEEVGRLLRACDAYEAGVRRSAKPMKIAVPFGPPSPEERAPTDREAADAIRLLLFTGARLREVLKAEWGQFDLEAGLWEKPSAHTKTNRQHRLELDGPALDLLRAMAERKTHPVYLFPGSTERRRSNAPIDIKTGQPKGVTPRVDLKRPWRAICALAELEAVQLHDLRRTTASFMLSGGASLATVGKALGHTQASTTARYATLSQTVQRAGLRAAGERMAATKAYRSS